MASVQITGVLKDPIDNISPNTPVRVTTVVGFGDTLRSAIAVHSTDASGVYDFNLVYGVHRIEVRYGDKFEKLGDVSVNDDLTGPLTIAQLFMLSTPVTDPILTEMSRILGEANTAADEAEQSAIRAEQAAVNIGNALVDKGGFDASTGSFPTPSSNSDVYNITSPGVLSDGVQPNLDVKIDDLIYYSQVNSRWFKIDNSASGGGGGGTGDMEASVYDPNNVSGDAFDMDNMVEGTVGKILTQSERDAITANTLKRSYPSEDETKLAGIGEGAQLVTVQGGSNITVDVTDPQNPIISSSGGGGGGTGDMEASVYDPQNIVADAFARTNHTGEQAISTVTGLQTELDAKALENEVVKKSNGTTGGIDVPRWADDAGRPDTTGLTKAILGFNTSRGEYEAWNPETGRWGAVGGGGLTEPTTPLLTEYPFTAETGFNINVDLSDDVSKEVVIPAGWTVGNGVTVSAVKWTGDAGVTITVNPDNSYEWDHPLLDLAPGAKMVIQGNSSATIQLTAEGKLKMVQSQIDQRTVKRGKTALYDGVLVGDGSDVPLSDSIYKFDLIGLYAEFAYNGTLRRGAVYVEPSDLITDVSLTDYLQVTAFTNPAPTTNTFYTGGIYTHNSLSNERSLRVRVSVGGGYTGGIYKVVGIKY